MTDERYLRRGVSASKEEVHAAIRDLDKGLFPNAFCKILPDLAAGDPDVCTLMHADTAGTKPSLAWMYWKETGDLDVWRGIVQDALVMNLDDLLCVGATGEIIISSNIARNKNTVPGEVVKELITGCADLIEQWRDLGVHITLAGGETADVGDIVRTVDVGYTAFARMPRHDVIDMRIRPGDVVVGLASFGQATYEDAYNGGMGSNGLTSARHDVFGHDLADRYPESFDPAVPRDLVYSGTKALTDIEPETGVTYGRLVLSPTRTYAPILTDFLRSVDRDRIHGLVHCSGGAQTKVLHFIDGVRVVKDDLFDIPPLFRVIEDESGTDRKEMFKVFNMGHRMECYTDAETAAALIETSERYGVDARIVGRVETAETAEVVIDHDGDTFTYTN